MPSFTGSAHSINGTPRRVEITVHMHGDLTDAQIQRLLRVGDTDAAAATRSRGPATRTTRCASRSRACGRCS